MLRLLAPPIMKRFAATSFALITLALVLNAAGDPAPGLETIRADALKGHIFFLASDAMAGRDSMSREGRIAADYIAGFFYRAGLKPVGDNGTFFQNFPMVDAHVDREHTRLAAHVVSKTGGTLDRDYANGPDYNLPRQGNVDVTVSAPLVFAGYGVTAPEYDYDDFKGVDVAGKVIMILAHEPQETDPASRFKGGFNTVHAYNWWKPEVARRRGAAAMLMVQDRVNHRPPRAISGPTNAQIRTDRGQHTLTSPFWDIPMFTITRRVADELLAPSGKTIDQLQDAIDRAGTPQSMAVAGVNVDLRRAIKDRQVVQTRNVVGVVEGSDPALKNEYVLVTGHYDHVGQKDQFIFHGADDNASACAAVIAMAEALTSTKERPKRSVMFLVFEAEEDGLLGAFHYIDHPLVPLDRTVAVLNMDMIGRDEESPTWNTHAADNRNSVNVVGTLYNPDLRKVIEAENQRIGLTLDYKTDKDDREGWFSRSDHYPFAIKSVPMVLFNTGEHPDYHTANDTWDRIDYPKIEKITRLVYLSAWNLANAAGRPRFVPGTVTTTSSQP
jgi:peptidase M28-like protein